MRFTTDNVETWKKTIASMVDLIPGGAIFAINDK